MIPGALEHLEKLFEELLAKERLAHAALQLDATPRRLVLVARASRRRRRPPRAW
ncbi:MAG: hypothetical protein U5J83_09840 [Bryobacterales bacterium]|nr:hypothetical protein [Bryobacterales bacterium]